MNEQNVARLFAGIGAEILMFKSELSLALDDVSRHLDAALGEFNKLRQAYELRKGAGSIEVTEAGARLTAALNAVNEALARADEAFPSWERHVRGPHLVLPTLYSADKTIDTYQGDWAQASEAGAVKTFGPQRSETPDPASKLGETYLRRRSDI